MVTKLMQSFKCAHRIKYNHIEICSMPFFEYLGCYRMVQPVSKGMERGKLKHLFYKLQHGNACIGFKDDMNLKKGYAANNASF